MCVCPIEKVVDVLLALKLFAKDVGASEDLLTDGARAKTSANFQKYVYQHWYYIENTRRRYTLG